jgi:hypothetical protein
MAVSARRIGAHDRAPRGVVFVVTLSSNAAPGLRATSDDDDRATAGTFDVDATSVRLVHEVDAAHVARAA